MAYFSSKYSQQSLGHFQNTSIIKIRALPLQIQNSYKNAYFLEYLLERMDVAIRNISKFLQPHR